MSVFARIDPQLTKFAAARHTVPTRDRHGESLRSWGPNNPGFEERRIDWQRDETNLAVIIQPDFGGMTVDSSKWHFYALAWQNEAMGSTKRVAQLRLVSGRPFPEIEARIEELLLKAGTYLDGLQERDLHSQIDLHHQREVRQQRAERRQQGLG